LNIESAVVFTDPVTCIVEVAASVLTKSTLCIVQFVMVLTKKLGKHTNAAPLIAAVPLTETPPVPAVPEVPEVPFAPEVPVTPEVPEVPFVPLVPDV
jgi:hypothetical protein